MVGSCRFWALLSLLAAFGLCSDVDQIPFNKDLPSGPQLTHKHLTGKIPSTGRSFSAWLAIVENPLYFGFSPPVGGCDHLEKVTTTAKSAQCLYATNGGFFDWSAGNKCHGNLVANGTIVQLLGTDKVIFGTTPDQFVAGFLSKSEVGSIFEWRDLISGSGWLVRDGVSYVNKTKDLSPTSGFVTEKAPRTAIGVTKDKKALILEADGEENIHAGLDLFEMAELLILQGAQTAINLDGGGSSVSVLNDKVISKPTCSDTSVICERYVNSIVCVRHA